MLGLAFETLGTLRVGQHALRVCIEYEPKTITPLAECQRAEVPVNRCQQLLSPRQTQRHMADIKVLHIMTALEVLTNIAFACTHKRQVSSACACDQHT